MRVYLDCCCFSRPFDSPANDRIAEEADAVRRCLELSEQGLISIFKSDVLRAEMCRITDPEKHELVSLIFERQVLEAVYSDEVSLLAKELQQESISPIDSLHLATAIVSRADFFITVDDRLCKRALRFGRLRETRVLNPVAFVREFVTE